jgi:hypothetical protein
MKTHVKKSAVIAAVFGAVVVAGITPTQAQETTGSTTASSNDSIVALAADSKSLPQVAPSQVPVRGGTYWWVYPGGIAVPTPMLPLDSSVQIYSVATNEYLVDLTRGAVSVNQYQLAATQGTDNPYAAAVTAQVQGLIDIITMVQNPPPATSSAMTLRASPMDGGGFSPMGQTQSGVPYLTIAQAGTNAVLVTVWNDIGPTNYDIQTTPVLTSPSWTAATNGFTGQTNFLINFGPYYTGFFRAIIDTGSVPWWQAADPSNPNSGVLAVFIDSPANGAIIQ